LAGAGRYAELAAAVHSFKAELIRPSQIERLVESGSVSEIVGALTKGQVTFGEESDLNPVEAFLVEKVVELTNRLASYAPHDSRSLIRLFSTGYELRCLKEIIRSIADQIPPDDALRHLVPTGEFTQERCKELIEARNSNRAVEMIRDEALKDFLVPRLTAERSGIAALSAIDQYYYTRLWRASNLPDPLDAQLARLLIGELIDNLNILLCFRARVIGLDAKATADLLIPVNYALDRSLTELTESTSVQNLTRVLEKTRYAKAFETSSLSSTKASDVELRLYRNHAIACLDAFAGSPFNVGLALALLFLKNYELHDLFCVINGRANNVPVEHILASLILRGL